MTEPADMSEEVEGHLVLEDRVLAVEVGAGLHRQGEFWLCRQEGFWLVFVKASSSSCR
jgi:hypothetical protein